MLSEEGAGAWRTACAVFTGRTTLSLGVVRRSFVRSRAHVAARHRADLDPELGLGLQLVGKLGWVHGSDLDHGVTGCRSDVAGPNDDAGRVEVEGPCVEEEDLADLGI